MYMHVTVTTCEHPCAWKSFQTLKHELRTPNSQWGRYYPQGGKSWSLEGKNNVLFLRTKHKYVYTTYAVCMYSLQIYCICSVKISWGHRVVID